MPKKKKTIKIPAIKKIAEKIKARGGYASSQELADIDLINKLHKEGPENLTEEEIKRSVEIAMNCKFDKEKIPKLDKFKALMSENE